jgi:aspartate/methionine/tyrosine aminotransferase
MPKTIAERPILGMTSALGQVMAEAKAREASGQPVFHLERGEPNFDTPAHIVEALCQAAKAGETHYPDARGSLPLRKALVEKLGRENRIACDPDDIVITVGGTHALFLAVQGLIGPGDELLVLSPHWMALPKIVGFTAGSTYRSVPVYHELQDGSLSPEALAARIAAAVGPKTRGIYLNTPNNPTGAMLDRDQLAAVAGVAIERDLWMISDEAYEHIVFDGTKHLSIAALPGMAERTLSVFTFSKTYAMTGWRVGYLVSPPSLRSSMGPLLSFYSTHGVFPAVQTAGVAAVTGPQDSVETMRRAYEERRDLLLSGLAGQSAIRVPSPKGAFYVFADVSAARGNRDLWALVREWLGLGVAVLPGTAFGEDYKDWVRISLASRNDDIVRAAAILREHYTPAAARR